MKIIAVNNNKALSWFINYPHRLYAGDPFYSPQLNLMQQRLLSPANNPFFQQAEAAFFLAINETGEIKGRIAAIHNRLHLDLYKDNTGFFGFFDCANDPATATALLDTAAGWLKGKGIQHMTGPENPGTNDSVGLLTRGFEKPAVFLMPYNFPYYEELLLKYGMKPVMQLYSYLFRDNGLPPALAAKAMVLEQRLAGQGIVIRPINLSRYEQEVRQLHAVYNEANQGNWGFLPLDKKSFFRMAGDLRKIVRADQILIVEKEDRIIGYSVSVPDLNQVFRTIPDGRLFPWGWYRLLTSRKKINGFRIMILGVLPDFRGMGIDWCLYATIASRAISHGMKWGEACYVMEENVPMNRMMKALEAERVCDYRLYSINL